MSGILDRRRLWNRLAVLAKGVFKILALIMLGVLILGLGYVLMSMLLTVIPTRFSSAGPGDGVKIYVISNGLHTDIIVPIRHPEIDWSVYVPMEQFRKVDPQARHVGFGWGDKAFYLETDDWNKLSAGSLARTVFLKTASAMHVTYYRDPEDLPDVRYAVLSEQQYRRLITYILSSFRMGDDGQPVWIAFGYGEQDAFYEATGSYHLFNTCNVWTGLGLQTAGVKVGLWTPFEFNVLYHLKPVEVTRAEQ